MYINSHYIRQDEEVNFDLLSQKSDCENFTVIVFTYTELRYVACTLMNSCYKLCVILLYRSVEKLYSTFQMRNSLTLTV